MSIEEENKAIARRWVEGLNKHDLMIIDEFFTTNCVFHVPVVGDVHGPEGLKQLYTTSLTAYPDLQYKIEDIIAEGDKIAARFTVRGTHKGDIMGIAPTGKQVMGTGIAIYRLVEGKFVEAWAIEDQLGIMQQLGVIPTPGQ
jgi:steroid delta-isomerase-like uncharacterized protein